MQFFNAEEVDFSCIKQRAADTVKDYTVIWNRMIKRYTNFLQE